MITLLLAALAQVGASTNLSEGSPPGHPISTPPREITDPDWRKPKNVDNPLRFYPEAAQRRGIEGGAIISCVVDAAGALHDCAVLEETPAGWGFGEAAMRMSVLFTMKPKSRSGQSVEGGVVRIPLRFKLPR